MHKGFVEFLLIMVFVFFCTLVYNGFVKMFTMSEDFVNIIKGEFPHQKIL